MLLVLLLLPQVVLLLLLLLLMALLQQLPQLHMPEMRTVLLMLMPPPLPLRLRLQQLHMLLWLKLLRPLMLPMMLLANAVHATDRRNRETDILTTAAARDMTTSSHGGSVTTLGVLLPCDPSTEGASTTTAI